MDILRTLRAIYLYIKSRYSKGFMILMILTYFIILLDLDAKLHMSSYPKPAREVVDSIIIAGSFSIILFGLIYPSLLTKSEVDFLLPTRVNPFKLLLIKQIGDSVILILFFLYLIIPVTISVTLGLINTLIFAFSLAGILILSGTLNSQKRLLLNLSLLGYLILTLLLYPKANLIYLIIYPSLDYSIIIVVFFIIVELLLYMVSKSLYLNAYSLSISPVAYKRGIIERIKFPRTFLGVIFYTTFLTSMVRFRFYGGQNYRNVRVPTILVILPLSIAGSLIIAFSRSSFLLDLILIYSIAFYIPFVGQSFQNERLWIDFIGVDVLKYIRARMLARLALSIIAFTPIALADFLANGNLSAMITFYALPFSSVPLTWFLMAFRPPPQIKDVEGEQIAYRFSLTGFIVFILIALVIWIPTLIALFLNSIFFSLGIFIAYLLIYVILLYIPKYSKKIWRLFVEKLAVNGYV